MGKVDFKQYFDKYSRPLLTLTDEIWQQDFEYLRKEVVPFINGETKRMNYKQSKVHCDDCGNFYPDNRTNYELYCQFINSTLREIRQGKVAFLFFEYQIKQLLCFHHDSLRTRYQDGFWEVWIEKGGK